MIGRAYLWGRPPTVEPVWRTCSTSCTVVSSPGCVDSAKASVHDLDPGDILVPAGFNRGLGV